MFELRGYSEMCERLIWKTGAKECLFDQSYLKISIFCCHLHFWQVTSFLWRLRLRTSRLSWPILYLRSHQFAVRIQKFAKFIWKAPCLFAEILHSRRQCSVHIAVVIDRNRRFSPWYIYAEVQGYVDRYCMESCSNSKISFNGSGYCYLCPVAE